MTTLGNRGKVGTLPIPRWMDDPDYYSKKDNQRGEHLAGIDRRKRIRAKTAAASGDGSYSIIVEMK